MKKTISILGCGWVGQVLAQKLELADTVHCLSRDIEANEKEKLYICDVLLIAIPPRENYLDVLTQIIFESDEVLGRVISSEKLVEYFGYEFSKPEPLAFC